MWILRVSGSVIAIASSRSLIARFSPIELVMPSLQLSVPGQVTTSVISSAPASARPSAPNRSQTSYKRLVADPEPQDQVLAARCCARSRR